MPSIYKLYSLEPNNSLMHPRLRISVTKPIKTAKTHHVKLQVWIGHNRTHLQNAGSGLFGHLVFLAVSINRTRYTEINYARNSSSRWTTIKKPIKQHSRKTNKYRNCPNSKKGFGGVFHIMHSRTQNIQILLWTTWKHITKEIVRWI